MTKKFTVPRGTSDILPENISLWQKIESKARSILNCYGYKEIRTPFFEETELFARSVGQTSEIVQKQMLSIASQTETKDSGVFALRPEGTASVVRSYIENGLDRKDNLSKLYYIGPMFRGERPQKGRLRQFHQIGVEAIGPSKAAEKDVHLAYLDAEIITLSVNLLRSFGLNNFKLKINSLGSKKDKANFSKYLRDILGKDRKSLCPDCQNRFERNVFRILDCKDKGCKSIVKKLQLSTDKYLSEVSQKYYSKVKDGLIKLGVAFIEDPCLVRGLDYYTHTVFELSDDSLGSQDAVGAGGRYDLLVSQLGGNDSNEYGALGFALGVERILLAKREAVLEDLSNIDAFLVAMGDDAFEKGFELINSLRTFGISIDMSYQPGSMKSQMRIANKVKAQYVLILGDDELNQGKIMIKDMDSGNQDLIELSEIKNILRSKLK